MPSSPLKSIMPLLEIPVYLQSGYRGVSNGPFIIVLNNAPPINSFIRFMDAGGWPMLNMWLVEAKKAHNIALIVELLQVSFYYIPTCTQYTVIQ